MKLRQARLVKTRYFIATSAVFRQKMLSDLLLSLIHIYVAKQVKETLARLTTKGKNKTSKYRKEKREMASNRMQELEDQEMADSKVLKLTCLLYTSQSGQMGQLLGSKGY